MTTIKQQYVGVPSKRTYGGTNDCYGITVHETANKADGATAQAHANLQSWYGTAGSWHAQADDIQVIESFVDTAQCFHAGDGRGTGNLRTLAIEICVNLDEDPAKQILAYRNAACWVAIKMKKYGIPLSRVFQHNHFSPFKKNCPTLLRGGTPWTWARFLDEVAYQYSLLNGGTPTTPPTSTNKVAEDGWWGRGTTAELQTLMGTPRDSVVSKQSSRWDQDNPGLTSGWEWVDPRDATGSTLIRAMMRWLGGHYHGEDDGLVGPEFFKGLQRKLKELGEYSGVVDGELWRESSTIKALQRCINKGKIKHN